MLIVGIIVIATLLSITIIVTLILVNRGIRASFNFNLIYVRALRIEGNKKIAISEAFKYLRTFLPPFDHLSDNQINMIAELFCDVDDPHKVLQPVLQQVHRSRSIIPYMDEKSLRSWKEVWIKSKSGNTTPTS